MPDLKVWRAKMEPGVVVHHPMGGEWLTIRLATTEELIRAASGEIEAYVLIPEKKEGD